MTEHNIRARIMAAAAAQPKAPARAARGPGLTTLGLGLAIMVMSVVTFAGWYNQRGKPVAAPRPAVAAAATPAAPPSLYATKADVEAGLAKTNAKLDALGGQVSVWGHRTWLLAVAHNENTNLKTAQDCARFGVTSPYIVFDENWKLNRSPSTLQFSDQQKKDLETDVK
jgi:hypothetical protein